VLLLSDRVVSPASITNGIVTGEGLTDGDRLGESEAEPNDGLTEGLIEGLTDGLTEGDSEGLPCVTVHSIPQYIY